MRPLKDPVQVLYKFKNDEKSSLGMPLPAGTVRVYQGDSAGSVLYAGEDRITHTPKDEQVSLHTGNAFDIVAERKQTDFRTLATQSVRDGVRSHAAQPQDHAHHRGSERAHRRRLADAQLDLPVDQDGRLRRAVQRAGGKGRHLGPALPRPRALVGIGQRRPLRVRGVIPSDSEESAFRCRRRKQIPRRSSRNDTSSCCGAEILQEELRDAVEDVNARGGVGDAVAAAGVDQKLGVFLRVHELVGQRQRIAEVHVVIAAGVGDEQFAAQAGRRSSPAMNRGSRWDCPAAVPM